MKKTKRVAVEQRIAVEQCCTYYNIETSFVVQLHEHGLIELSHSGEQLFIEYDQLPNLEKYIRMHDELEINIAGMEAIGHLLERLQHLQQELKRLRDIPRY